MPADVVRPDALPGELPATVPGAVHLDLMAAGELVDPLVGLNEARVQWVGRLDWEYRATVEVGAHELDEPASLVFEGLDTVATVHLNGTRVHASENMHRSWRVDVTGVLRPGANELTVRFDSALVHAEELQRTRGAWPNDYPHPYNQIRKHASSFGWDWGPTLVGAGLWRPVSLEVVPTAALTGLQVRTEVPAPAAGEKPTTADATVHVVADVVVATDAAAELVVRGPGGAVQRVPVPTGSGSQTVRADLAVADVELWFPTGYGPATLHDVDVDLVVDGRVVDTRHRRTGFRSIVLDTARDRHGRACTLVVNGRPVFAKGFNWIPDDPFPTRTTAADHVARLEQAQAAGANLVRVWGGGLFEDETFYRCADERGLLVWQDFLLACAGYPEEEPLRSEVEAEAREAVRRLSAHPSVVLWNGGNENLLGHSDWGWPQKLDGRPWGEAYARELFPAVVAELDPGTPYLVNSPHSSDEVTPNFPGEGTTHQWDTWNRLDHRHYRDAVPRFAAEYGWQAPATLPTLRAALGADALRWDSPEFLAHQKQTGGGQRLVDRLAGHVADLDRLLAPEAFADFHLATSLNQAEALRTAIEHLRSWWPRCAGSVVWQLNDCWPVTSWAVVDGHGVPKLGWYAARAAHADRLVTVQPREDGLSLVLVNDTDEPWTAEAVVRRCDLDGTERARTTVPAEVAPRSTSTHLLPVAVSAPWHQRRELLVAEVAGLPGGAASRSVWRFADRGRLELAPGRRTAELLPAEADGLVRVRVRAEETCLDLALLTELVDPAARADTALVTLLPGEEHVFAVEGLTGAEPDRLSRLLDPDVLRCANEVARA
ncbi:glycoside hydrolase family 2 protein [Desertihabitans brevis]